MRRLTATIGLDDAHLHDMRRCIATWCGNKGVRPDVIDLILSHKPRDVTRRHYNFAGMDCPVREAMQAWADHVWEITDQSL
jgi:integrase